jgi:malate dehydrogenase (oxaloacetate-decarboxylating)(NADP+)
VRPQALVSASADTSATTPPRPDLKEAQTLPIQLQHLPRRASSGRQISGSARVLVGCCRMSRREDALKYHATGRPGKIEVTWTKPVASQLDLSLAYTPGVAEPCREIAEDKDRVDLYTARRNLVAVVTNGTAVLGLGNIGPHAAKPVMEGKAVLFKRFADIDVFDLELAETDPDRFVQIVQALEPTFGGINLEDIRAPDCFVIERALRERMSIPVFHDDQHGTAIITTAALRNAAELVDKPLDSLKVTCIGAGAAAISCMQMWVRLGVRRENITMTDVGGVLWAERGDIDEFRAPFARPKSDPRRTLAEAMVDADVMIGLSAGNVVSPAMLKSMAKKPIIFALANPDPEIDYPLALETRPDAVLATGAATTPIRSTTCSASRTSSVARSTCVPAR